MARIEWDLIDLTIATFGAFYEVSFASVVGESIFSHQHGDWREDDREQVSALNDPASGKYVGVAVAAGLRVRYVGWKVDEPEGTARSTSSPYRQKTAGGTSARPCVITALPT